MNWKKRYGCRKIDFDSVQVGMFLKVTSHHLIYYGIINEVIDNKLWGTWESTPDEAKLSGSNTWIGRNEIDKLESYI